MSKLPEIKMPDFKVSERHARLMGARLIKTIRKDQVRRLRTAANQAIRNVGKKDSIKRNQRVFIKHMRPYFLSGNYAASKTALAAITFIVDDNHRVTLSMLSADSGDIKFDDFAAFTHHSIARLIERLAADQEKVTTRMLIDLLEEVFSEVCRGRLFFTPGDHEVLGKDYRYVIKIDESATAVIKTITRRKFTRAEEERAAASDEHKEKIKEAEKVGAPILRKNRMSSVIGSEKRNNQLDLFCEK